MLSGASLSASENQNVNSIYDDLTELSYREMNQFPSDLDDLERQNERLNDAKEKGQNVADENERKMM